MKEKVLSISACDTGRHCFLCILMRCWSQKWFVQKNIHSKKVLSISTCEVYNFKTEDNRTSTAWTQKISLLYNHTSFQWRYPCTRSRHLCTLWLSKKFCRDALKLKPCITCVWYKQIEAIILTLVCCVSPAHNKGGKVNMQNDNPVFVYFISMILWSREYISKPPIISIKSKCFQILYVILCMPSSHK